VANVTSATLSPATRPMLRAPPAMVECGVTVANQYYLAACFSPEAPANDRDPAAPFASSLSNPTHVNVTAAGVHQQLQESKAATMLIRGFPGLNLSQAQRATPPANNEYPTHRVR